MSQLSLFEPTESVLTDAEHGRIVYTPGLASRAEAAAWFAALRRDVDWSAQRRRMYDRDVDVPRLTASFQLGGDRRGLPASLQAAAARVADKTGVAFTSVGLNLYRDGRDSVAPHNDHLDEIVAGFPIALVSLGATRRMVIRTKAAPARVWRVDLEAGSLLVMSYETQVHCTHGIPKTREAVGERISLAFRVKSAAPREDAARY